MKLFTIILLPYASAFAPTCNGFISSRHEALTPSSNLYSTAPVLEKEEVAIAPMTLSRPEIHWTVPGYKIGWQDKEGKWFDEDGPRKGPPQNYWRQSVDQGDYNRDMEAVTQLLSPDCNVEALVKNLMNSRSTRKPSLNRKVLGSWAPILFNGKCLASISASKDTTNATVVVEENNTPIEVPYQIQISRKNGRRFAPKNHYGTFDKRLESGEDISISTSTKYGDTGFIVTVFADEDNTSRIVGMIGTRNRVPLHFGGIVYITDYVMLQRNDDGEYDFWLRVDKSHLGATPEELEQYEEKSKEE